MPYLCIRKLKQTTGTGLKLNIKIMITLTKVIENLKGGKSAYECMRICQNAKSTISKDELPKLNEMIAYYGGTHDELSELTENFVETF